jgi:hypothetical protein
MKPTPLIDREVLLEKFQGKGGWTYIQLPDIPKDQRRYFGLVKVYGKIDAYELPTCNLMPVKNGILMLPVNAGIRKQIKKEAGAKVHLTLYAADASEPEIIPDDFMECLRDEPAAFAAFQSLSKDEQSRCLQWVMENTVTEARIQRMADAINHLAAGRNWLGVKKSSI